jgi:16S rRNA (adenine1518-N6/adenine1519-N6)-dimethyltransferase
MNKNSRQRLIDYRQKKAQKNSDRSAHIDPEQKKFAPKKSLGQNFLVSQTALNKIIEASMLNQKSTVLEIGPGKGALTERLLLTGATVIAVEKDSELIPYLQEKFSAYIKNKKFQLFKDDILKIDLTRIGIGGKKDGAYTVVANIPYYITGEIMKLFLDRVHKPETIVFLVQKEVAERITKKDNKESILSLSVHAYGTPRYIATVPRGAFVPSPNVDSAIIQIRNISGDNFTDIVEQERFLKIIKAGFKSKRKYAFSNLLSLFKKDILETKFSELNLSLKIRPEEIPLSAWLTLTKSK